MFILHSRKFFSKFLFFFLPLVCTLVTSFIFFNFFVLFSVAARVPAGCQFICSAANLPASCWQAWLMGEFFFWNMLIFFIWKNVQNVISHIYLRVKVLIWKSCLFNFRVFYDFYEILMSLILGIRNKSYLKIKFIPRK